MDTNNQIKVEYDRWMQSVIREWNRAGDRFANRMWDRTTTKDIIG